MKIHWNSTHRNVCLLLKHYPLTEYEKKFVDGLLTTQPALSGKQVAYLGHLSWKYPQARRYQPGFWWDGRLEAKLEETRTRTTIREIDDLSELF